jgi:hypothetical protein
MYCVVCKTPLRNGIDTFNEVGLEMCWDCYSGLFEDALPTHYTTFVTISADKPPFVTITTEDIDFDYPESDGL